MAVDIFTPPTPGLVTVIIFPGPRPPKLAVVEISTGLELVMVQILLAPDLRSW